MNDRVQRLLEFDKIKLRLRELAGSEMGRELIDQMIQSSDPSQIRNWRQETSEASGIIIQLGQVHMGPVHDVRPGLQLAAIGSYMLPWQLLQVSGHTPGPQNP